MWFWDKAQVADGCWLWLGSVDQRTGYARVKSRGKYLKAHRVAWTIANGREPQLLVCHSCDNRICVNPDHLWEGTHADNMRDMVIKGRAKKPFCRNGHEYTPENTVLDGGAKRCRSCLDANMRRATVRRSAGVLVGQPRAVGRPRVSQCGEPDCLGHSHCPACRRNYMREYMRDYLAGRRRRSAKAGEAEVVEWTREPVDG